jgi:hypothetical protein
VASRCRETDFSLAQSPHRGTSVWPGKARHQAVSQARRCSGPSSCQGRQVRAGTRLVWSDGCDQGPKFPNLPIRPGGEGLAKKPRSWLAGGGFGHPAVDFPGQCSGLSPAGWEAQVVTGILVLSGAP